jgi:1-acyl-sn-glycerol-3-phosphate acyltransferase
LRGISFPFELLYRCVVTRTVVLGQEKLADLPRRVIFAGTHHGFPDLPLVRHALAQTPAQHFVGRLVVAAGGEGFATHGLYSLYSILAFGIYPLRQHGEREVSLRRLAQLAAAGNAVLIFPQGVHADPVRERAGDPAARFHAGVAHLAAALDAVVVPFGLAGTELMVPPNASEFAGLKLAGIPVSVRRGPLAIAFGRPLRLAPGESAQDFTERLQDACYALTRQAEQALGQETGTTTAGAGSEPARTGRA